MNSLCQHVHLRQRKSEIQFIFKALDKNNDSELTTGEGQSTCKKYHEDGGYKQ